MAKLTEHEIEQGKIAWEATVKLFTEKGNADVIEKVGEMIKMMGAEMVISVIKAQPMAKLISEEARELMWKGFRYLEHIKTTN